MLFRSGLTAAGFLTLAQDTVHAFGTSKSLHVPGDYTLTVKPLNCGAQPQPAITSHFSLSF